MDKFSKHGKFPILNTYGWFIIIINLAFFIVNTISLCINFPRTKDLGIDYLGMIVGALSILVTVLIGWQIFINISFEKRVDNKLSEVTKELRDEINKNVELVSVESEDKRHASIAMSLYQSSCSAYLLKKYDFALWLALDSILHYNMIKNKNKVFDNGEYVNIVETLNLCIQLVPQINFLNTEQINKYRDVAESLKLLEVAYFLKYKSTANNNLSGNYINNLNLDRLPEGQEVNYIDDNNTNSFII